VPSELYFGNGTNLFSLVEGEDQLLWESRFAPPEPGLAQARREALVGARPAAGEEGLDAIAGRLFEAFEATPPLHGRGSPSLAVRRWGEAEAGRGTEAPARTAALARRLAARWYEFVGAELTPAEEDREWIDQLPQEAAESGGSQ
jgi:hypothetical protein